VRAAVASPDREKKLARARLSSAQVKAGQPFGDAVAEFSDEARASAGELEFQTRAELSDRYGLLVAEALWALPESEVSEVLETPEALLVARVIRPGRGRSSRCERRSKTSSSGTRGPGRSRCG
jgi:hypothetical protein